MKICVGSSSEDLSSPYPAPYPETQVEREIWFLTQWKLIIVENTFSSNPSDLPNRCHAVYIAAWFWIWNVLVFFHIYPTLSPLWHIINIYIPKLSSMCMLFVYVRGRGSCLASHLLVSRYVKRLEMVFKTLGKKLQEASSSMIYISVIQNAGQWALCNWFAAGWRACAQMPISDVITHTV